MIDYRDVAFFGNAVPIGLARAIGKALTSVANNNFDIKTKRFRKQKTDVL